ncbi:MAG: efflux RND transporter permease subunit [Planctomycetes bacterium]|nr:efflux RND transporter permease subunit [Planctomycetota bacterium]
MTALLRFAVTSRVFANLLMVALVAAGLVGLRRMTRELFPEFANDEVTVTVVYPGAAPEEVEAGVTLKIEEATRGVEGVRRVRSESTEGRALVTLEVDRRARTPQDVMIDVQNEVDRIDTFPDDIKRPVVQVVVNRREVLSFVLHGDVDEDSLARLGRELEDDLLRLTEVREVRASGLRTRQLSVLLREADLLRHGLTFDQVVAAARGASIDLPLGPLRGAREELVLRVERERGTGRELAQVPLVTRPDGARVLLGDVARVDDGFVEDPLAVRVDGRRAVFLGVQRVADQDTIRLARLLREWAAARAPALPEGVTLEPWQDHSLAVAERLDLMTTNGLQGLCLVFACLVLFLGGRLSLWVAAGLPVAFLAGLALLAAFGGTLNMISTFGLIMVLGIVVDDAIVVAENVARHLRERAPGASSLEAAVAGVSEVAWPVVTSVTTTALAFLPLAFLEGTIGKFTRIMPVAVVACLIASLVEALLILPAHLAHGRPPGRGGLRERLDRSIAGFVERRYGPTVDLALRHRYVTLTLSVAFVIVVGGLVAGGRPRFVFFPALDAEVVQATVTMPQGTPFHVTDEVARRVEAAARTLRDAFPPADDGGPVARRVLARVGEGGPHRAVVSLELARSGLRRTTSEEVLRRWREATGGVPLARAVLFEGQQHRPGGRALELRLADADAATAALAAARVREALGAFPGVINVDDNLEPGKRELRLAPGAGGDAAGLLTRDLARQLQAGFTGAEVQTLQRGREEVEVRVRYAREERGALARLPGLWVRAGDAALPLSWAVEVEPGRGLAKVERRDGRRVAQVFAEVDEAVTNANEVVRALQAGVLADLRAAHPGLVATFGGAQEEQRDTVVGIVVGFLLACLGIYALLGLLFESYLQPLIIMAAIPVGFAGAVLGHVVVGWPLTIFSVFGMVGLSGIVVNDGLVLIDFVNRRRRAGMSALEAARVAGRVRFQAVALTTITTVAGLAPLLLERAISAQLLIPMAVSIASGVAAATLVTLYAVPAAYVALDDVVRLVRGRWAQVVRAGRRR